MKMIGGSQPSLKNLAREFSPLYANSCNAFIQTRATFRIVEGDIDLQVDHLGVERAWQRAEQSRINEERVSMTGRLLGIVPLHRRVEFQPDDGQVVYGKVSDDFSHSYLERINTEQFAGKRWRALFHRKLVERPGRPPAEDYSLLTLADVDAVPNVNPLEIPSES